MNRDAWMAAGQCGGPIPSRMRLPLIVGDPEALVATCPVADAQADEDVLAFAALVPSPYGPGLLDGAREMELPPRYRGVRDEAAAWLEQWKAQQRVPTVPTEPEVRSE